SEHRVKTHHRKQQRDARKRDRKPHRDARENERRAERGIHRSEERECHRTVERGERGTYGRLQRRGIAVGTDNEGADRLRNLAKRHIYFVWRRLGEVGAFHVGRHADDFSFNFSAAAAEQYFAERGFVVEKSFRERLVDDANIRGLVVITFIEHAAFAERDSHRREVMFAHSIEPGTTALGKRQRGPSFDRVSRARLKSRE